MQEPALRDMENERIDFEEEIKVFKKDSLIKGFEMLEVTPISGRIRFETLEGYSFLVTIQVGKGITIEEATVDLDEKRFDSFEQILAKYSHAYNQAFNAKLNDKLLDFLKHQNEDKTEQESSP